MSLREASKLGSDTERPLPVRCGSLDRPQLRLPALCRRCIGNSRADMAAALAVRFGGGSLDRPRLRPASQHLTCLSLPFPLDCRHCADGPASPVLTWLWLRGLALTCFEAACGDGLLRPPAAAVRPRSARLRRTRRPCRQVAHVAARSFRVGLRHGKAFACTGWLSRPTAAPAASIVLTSHRRLPC